MKRSLHRALAAAFAALVAAEALAVRHVGIEADALNRVYPASFRKSFVFSPVSFELDCVLIAESLDTIPKANVASMMGVVIDFPSAYRPVVEALGAETNGLACTSARGFCVPDIRAADANFRTLVQREYGAEVMRLHPKAGAEAWFKATMDGEMEEFEIPVAVSVSDRFSFYDLLSVRAAWEEPFPPSNTKVRPFRVDGASNTVDVAFMSDVRVADTLEMNGYTILSLPLKGGSAFFAMLPKDGYALSDIKMFFNSVEIDGVLSMLTPGSPVPVVRGPCAIDIPRIELFSRTSLSGALRYFHVPTTGLRGAAGDAPGGEFVQYAKFSIVECGRGERLPADGIRKAPIPASAEVRRMALDRPFLFFVYHPATATILVAGQFTGVM